MRRPRTVKFERRVCTMLSSATVAATLALLTPSGCSSHADPPVAAMGGSGGQTEPREPDAAAPADTAMVPDARGLPPDAPSSTEERGADARSPVDVARTDLEGSGVSVGPLTGVVPIMVLGSSNETNTCWRAFLWQRLREAGIMNFDFVGRSSVGPDCGVAGYDKDVEAAPGTIITGFSANDFAVRFKAHPPRIVLVHVGGADARNGIPAAKIMEAYSLAVEQARAVDPQVIFLVAQHTPQQPANSVNALNAAIPAWAMQISTPRSPVVAVDLFTGILPSDLSDGTHLNAAGSQKVAQRFAAILIPLFKP